jgi:uncharacterized protein (TIGR00251 family)
MGVEPAWLQRRPGGFALELHVQPGARRTAIVGDHGGRLKIAVNAPPLEGRANEAVLQLLSERLGVARRAVALEAGTAGRDKRVLVSSALTSADAVRRLLPPQK